MRVVALCSKKGGSGKTTLSGHLGVQAELAGAGSGGPGPADRVNLTVRIDRTLHTRLRLLAARQQRTNQDIVEGALEAYLGVFAPGCACVGSAKPKT
jgi:cellulose biosynthesis protein BcsQ